MSKHPPLVGDRIVHVTPVTGAEREGIVIQILAMQFVYLADGQKVNSFCMFHENWSVKEKVKRKIKKSQIKIKVKKRITK